jgi:Kelch motif/Galactose oxidase, central domain
MTLLPNGTVLVAGGYSSEDALYSAEIYDPGNGTFTPTGNMNSARRIFTMTLLNDGTVLAAGGFNGGGTLGSAELYDPSTGTFTFTGNLNAIRYYHTATLLNNGMALIAGGLYSTGNGLAPLASAELYNPANGTFTLTGSLNTARAVATATLLNDGTVLVAGGQNGGSETTVFASAELYDPATATFAPTASLNVPRFGQTATLLNNGTVLIAGGSDSAGAIASAELYEPGN